MSRKAEYSFDITTGVGSTKCPPCNGTGRAWGVGPADCPLCKGEGILPNTRANLPECHFCGGNGRREGLYPSLCPRCGGYGRRERKPVAVDPLAPEARINDLVLSLGVREFGTDQRPSIIQVQAGKPRTAHLEVGKLLNSLTGEVRLCDPYYGKGSLFRLDELTGCTSVLFLTRTPDNKERTYLDKAIQEFLSQRPHFQLRKHIANELHDRYIITADELILLGHGLKDIGNKESFVVRLDRTIAGDTIDISKDSFDDKWQRADPLP